MAKSANFFGLRRGSTKSLTFQVFRGQQVTKDRVTTVTNPQSSAQMQQRLCLPLVANAKAVLKSLVNHSWEGVTYGNDSLKLFSQLNLSKDALTIREYVPKGAMDCGLADFYISRGSLEPLTTTQDESNHFLVDQVQQYVGTDAEGTEGEAVSGSFIQSFLDQNTKLQSGDQLTFLVCIQGDAYKYAKNADEDGEAHYHKFVISRLILDPTNGDSNWKFKSAGSSFTISDGYMSLEMQRNPGSNVSKPLDVVVDSSKLGVEDVTIESRCAILSRKVDNVWKRSTQRMEIWDSELITPITYNDVLYTYLNASSVSTKYLNSGTDGVSITGGAA